MGPGAVLMAAGVAGVEVGATGVVDSAAGEGFFTSENKLHKFAAEYEINT